MSHAVKIIIHLCAGVALLRPEWRSGFVPVPERHHLLASRTHLRLVVQRQVRLHRAVVRAQREPLQVHPTAFAQVPRGLQWTFGG